MSNDPLDVRRSISFHSNLPGDGGTFDGRPQIGDVRARSATGRLRPRPRPAQAHPSTARFSRAVHAGGLMQEIDQPPHLDTMSLLTSPTAPLPKGRARMRSKRATSETGGRRTPRLADEGQPTRVVARTTVAAYPSAPVAEGRAGIRGAVPACLFLGPLPLHRGTGHGDAVRICAARPCDAR